MSRSPSARLRGAVTGVVLLAGTWPLQSQEKPAPPPAPAPSRTAATDTLEATRDGLRGLRVGREAQNPATGTLPRIAAPEWHGGGAAPAPSVRPLRPVPAAEAPSPNWLVDALQKPDVPVPGRDREDRRSGKTGAPASSDRAAETSGRKGLAPAESRSDSERGPAGPRQSGAGAISNPLAAYLDDWMTPQDFALLKPGLDGRTAAVRPPTDPGLMPGGWTAGLPSVPGPAPGANVVPVGPAGDSRGALRENPFLSALNTPAPPPPARSSFPAPGPAATPSSFTPPPSPAPAPRIPDFARPAADEKYFKPLKRF